MTGLAPRQPDPSGLGPFTLGPAILFVPGDRPDRFAKAAERADAVILDLEDAVTDADRPAARAAVADSRLDPGRTIVRINPAASGRREADLQALAETDYRYLMQAKTEGPGDLEALMADGEGRWAVVALCETARGVVQAAAIAAHPAVVAMMWGAEDLIASLGGTSSRFPDGRYRQVTGHARSTVLLAAGAHGAAAIDAVHLDLADHEGLAAEAEDAVASGFAATACLHPSQVPIVRRAHRPTDEELAAARRVLEQAAGRSGAFALDGRMVDEVVLAQARAVVRRAEVTR